LRVIGVAFLRFSELRRAAMTQRAAITIARSASELEIDVRTLRNNHPQLEAHMTLGVAPAKALRHLGLSAWNRGEPKLAVTVLRAAAAMTPQDATIWADLSGAHYACAQPMEARDTLLYSLEHDNSVAARWLSLAGLYRETGCDDEAESAFLKVVALDPASHDAWVGLGILHFQRRRFPQAVDALRRSIQSGSRNVAVHACLGEALYLQGDISGAAEAYLKQIQVGASESKIIQKFAFIVFLQGLIGGPIEKALVSYRAAAGEFAEDPQKLIQNAFHALSGYGFHEAAIRCGRARLDHQPDDPIQRYLTAALEGAPFARAPDDYLIHYFDQFADTFDQKLVDVLDYRIPEKLCAELETTDGTFGRCLDAGCGTGLAGSFLRAQGRHLTGVDVSSGMLTKATARNVYDRLIEAEIHDFLESTNEIFDLILAADVLVYIGDLQFLLAHAAKKLAPEGIFAFSVEITEKMNYVLLSSGRFAHRPDYIRQTSRGQFSVERAVPTQIRLDVKGPAAGMMFILRKAPAR
jgi:predicted TPR repeat methyltransferase/Flp pilus assembly protein TadD